MVALAVLPTGIAWLRAKTSTADAFVSLPPSGPGWRSTSSIVGAMGRQYLRAVPMQALQAALTALHEADPGRVFVVADSGHDDGGPFPPHATHRDGRSVDILVPLIDGHGAPTTLSTWPWNLWGYCWHLDDDGRVRGLRWEAKPVELPLLGATRLCPTIGSDDDDDDDDRRLDFEALAQLIVAVEREARVRGSGIERVIIAPEYRATLLATPTGRTFGPLAARVPKMSAWVRHDEHVHIDFVASRSASSGR